MDIATVIGLILGIIVVVGSIVLGGTPEMFVNAPSLILVLAGTVAAVSTAFPISNLIKLPSVLMKVVFTKATDAGELIKQLVGFAEIARRDGILTLENHINDMNDPFIVQGIQMAVDGTDPELIEQIMEADLENLMVRHENGRKLLEAMGRYAPAFGMIGTLIGLITMLGNMDDPSNIGAGMAVALLTTLYGALLANVVFLPLADKLGVRSEDEVLVKTIIIKGVMSIQAGDNPRVVGQKLKTFLPPRMRIGENEEEMRAAA